MGSNERWLAQALADLETTVQELWVLGLDEDEIASLVLPIAREHAADTERLEPIAAVVRMRAASQRAAA